MTKQEEIREGIARIGLGGINPLKNALPNEYGYKIADDILSYLHSQGVVIKVKRELPYTIPVLPKFLKRGIITDDDLLEYARVTEVLNRMEYIKAGYVAVEPLIEEVKDNGL